MKLSELFPGIGLEDALEKTVRAIEDGQIVDHHVTFVSLQVVGEFVDPILEGTNPMTQTEA